MAVVLTLTFGTYALAGIIETPPEAPKAPAPSVTIAVIVLTLIQSLP
jgi:hypothetical protein